MPSAGQCDHPQVAPIPSRVESVSGVKKCSQRGYDFSSESVDTGTRQNWKLQFDAAI
ncbi:hypothetical protein BH11PSE11_BH11PSE11_27010 [soil metagenome]